MWIFLSIAAFLTVLITAILMLPVYIIIQNDENNRLMLRYKILFKTFGEQPDPNNPIVKALKKATGISKLEKNKLQSSAKEIGLSTTVSQALAIVTDLLGELATILKYGTVKKAYIKVVCAEEDAADTAISYGKCCAILYPFVGFLNAVMKVREKGQQIDISCDYFGGSSDLRFDFLISIRLCRVLAAFFRTAFEEAKRTADDQRANPQQKQNDHTKQSEPNP